MKSNDFIHFLTKEGVFKLNDDKSDYLRPYEVEQAKKIFDAFEIIGNALNSSSKANGEVFARAMILGAGHRTLEQNTVRMMFQIIEELAQNPKLQHTDARNEQSRSISKELIELFVEKKGFLPSTFLGSI